jgi:hypothetical protein
MSNGAQRARTWMRAARRIAYGILRLLWKIVRIVLIAGAAMGPGTPPPPPPPRPVAELRDPGGEVLDEQ